MEATQHVKEINPLIITLKNICKKLDLKKNFVGNKIVLQCLTTQYSKKVDIFKKLISENDF